jgi:hypothetical protein
MPGFEAWDIVKAPFSYADRPVRQRRRALVLAAGDLEVRHGLLWLAMITARRIAAGRSTQYPAGTTAEIASSPVGSSQ